MELRVLGPLQVLEDGRAIAVGGGRERALLVALGVRRGDALSVDVLVDALWGERPPRSATKQLQNQVLRLRKVLGPDAIRTTPLGYAVGESVAVDTARFESGLRDARAAAARGAARESLPIFAAALAEWRGRPFEELSGWAPAEAEAVRLEELRRLGQEEEIDARLGCGADAECVADLDAMVSAEPLREHRWAQLMVALYRSGRQGDALRAYQQARQTLARELGIEPGPELQATERAVLAQDPELRAGAPRRAVDASLPSGVVTFLLTDIEGSSRLWEGDPVAMARAIARLEETIAAAVAASAGTLLKSKGEGDSTLSVFARATDAIVAALAVRDRLDEIDWPAGARLSVRCALHTGESVERDGDYFGPALNRAARIRALAVGGQILVSQATAELVRDYLPDDADLVELGPLALRDLERPERIFALVEPGKPGRDVAGAVCPYPGLLAFQLEDHERFFGREALVDTLVGRLAATRLVAVVGASGSGKSSLVRAGVVPRLAPDGRVMVMTPGARPLAEPATQTLEAAVAEGTRLVLVVDQLEELFVLCADVAERRRFLDVLVAAVTTPQEHTAVVVALRADFYGHCADHPVFAELVAAATVLLGPMQPDELRAAIEGPARVTGLRLEPGLADLVLADVAGEPGALPLLSHALLETWRRRRGHTLTVAGYRDSGGVQGAIARTAETIYDTLTPDQQATARNVFVRLTEVGQGTEDTRRRVTIPELAPPEHTEEASAVLEILADARLVTIGEDTIEIAHEALIREWPRLRRWLDDDREGLRTLGHLNRAANDWAALGRDPGALYRGVRLAAVLQWLAGAPSTELNALEREFLDASGAAHDVELSTARRTTRRMRMLAIGLGAAFVIALVAGFVAIGQRNRADHTAQLADSSRLAAQARLVSADRLDLGLLLAAQSRRLAKTSATDGGLESVLARVPPGLDRSVRIPLTSGVAGVSPDGRLLALPGADGRVHLVDRDFRAVRLLPGLQAGSIGLAQFSHDGAEVVGNGIDTVTVWNARTGKPVGPPLHVGHGPVFGVFDPTDPAGLFTVGDGTVAHWDLRDPGHPMVVGSQFHFAAAPNDVLVMHLSPSGGRIAFGSLAHQTTTVWDTRSGAVLQASLPGIDGPFTPDGALLTLARGDRVVLVDPVTGAEQGTPLTGFRYPNPGIVISGDGRYLAASDLVDDSMRVFDLTTRQQVGPALAIFTGTSFPVEFLPGERLLTIDGGRATVWHFTAQTSPLATLLPVHDAGIVFAGFTPDGAEVITVGRETHVAHRWRTTDGADLGRFLDDRAAPVRLIGFSPDGKTVVTSRPDGTGGLFDATSGAPLSVLDAHQASPLKTVWSPRGAVVATASDDLSLVLWDVSDPRHPRVTARLQTGTATGQNLYPFFSPDGRQVVADNYIAGTAIVYTAPSGRRVRAFQNAAGFTTGAAEFTPDGKTIVLGLTNGPVKMIDAATGRPREVLAQPPGNQGFTSASGHRLVTLLTPVGAAGFIPQTTNTTGADTTAVGLFDARLQQIGERMTLSGGFPFAGGTSPDGTRYATGTSNSPHGSPAVWDLDPDRWAATACRIAGRNLTRAEWAQYLPNTSYQRTCPQWPAGR